MGVGCLGWLLLGWVRYGSVGRVVGLAVVGGFWLDGFGWVGFHIRSIHFYKHK